MGPYPCTECPKSFAQLSTLETHKRTHTGERPFFCDQCPMTFGDNGNLRKHKMRHAGTLPLNFVCDICSKAFNQQWALDGHKRTHTGERPFVCEHCDRPFSDQGNLKKHKEKKHFAPARESLAREAALLGQPLGWKEYAENEFQGKNDQKLDHV